MQTRIAFGKFFRTLCLLLLCFDAFGSTWGDSPSSTFNPNRVLSPVGVEGTREANDTLHFDTLLITREQVVCAAIDPLNQIIVAQKNGRIQRLDSLAQTVLVEYNNPRLGAPTLLDATNPLQILVYYADYQLIKLLNRNLIEIASLDLNQLGYTNVHVVASARDGNIWIYDAMSFQLKKINEQGKVLLQGVRINAFLNLDLSALKDHGETLVARASDDGTLIFDAFGQFTDYIINGQVDAFYSESGRVYILQNQKLVQKKLFGDPEIKEYTLPLFRENDSYLYLLNEQYLLVQNPKEWIILRLRK
jgi:hypothetical protein